MNIRFLFIIFFLLPVSKIESQTKITMQKEGGVYTIPCKVNGLELKFIFDTGASNVTISLTEALFMLKNGFLAEHDIIGSSYTQLANGEITENTEILIREIVIANLTLYNVRSSIVHNLGAPLLLGQTAISKLGRIQLDGDELTIFTSSNDTINSHELKEEEKNTKYTLNTKDNKLLNNDNTINTVVIDDDLKIKIYGQGLGLRKIISTPIILASYDKKAKVVLQICVNEDGNVISSEIIEHKSSTSPTSFINFSIRKSKEFKFEPLLLESQCGFMVFEIN